MPDKISAGERCLRVCPDGRTELREQVSGTYKVTEKALLHSQNGILTSERGLAIFGGRYRMICCSLRFAIALCRRARRNLRWSD